jgi:multicomponent Na+:H+ antiporter subunit C
VTVSLWFGLTGVALLLTGAYGVVVCAHALRKLLALNIMGSGVFLVFIAGAYRGDAGDPDPVPHALVLTGIVVALSTTALALAILRGVRTATTAHDNE